jgi:hypothetical protein
LAKQRGKSQAARALTEVHSRRKLGAGCGKDKAARPVLVVDAEIGGGVT